MNFRSLAQATAMALMAMPVLSTAAVPGGGPPTPAWSVSVEHEIRWFKTTTPGTIVVGTEAEILGIGADSGSVLWKLGPIKKSHADNVELLSGSPFAILSLGEQKENDLPAVSLLDLRDGRRIWVADSLGALKSIGSFMIPGTDRLLLRATARPKGDRRVAVLLEASTGRAVWTSAALGEAVEPILDYALGTADVRGRQVPLLDSDSTMVFQANRSQFQKYDIRTGTLIWKSADQPAARQNFGDYFKASGSERHTFAFNYAPMLVSAEADRFYAPYMNTVAPFSLSTGRRLWEEAIKLGGLVAQMEETPAGLLVRTVQSGGEALANELCLLDLKTGATLWKMPKGGSILKLKAAHWDGGSNFLMEEGRVVLAAEGKLRAFDLRRGAETILAKLNFKADDRPRSLRRAEKGYCVIGSSNLGIYASQNGECIASYYREAPNNAGWGFALLGLSALASTAAPVNLGSGVTVSGGVDAGAGVREILRDYSASQEREDFVYFLADMKSQNGTTPGIVRVRSETGEVAGEIPLGSKEPEYAIGAEGRLFYRADSKVVQCFRF